MSKAKQISVTFFDITYGSPRLIVEDPLHFAGIFIPLAKATFAPDGNGSYGCVTIEQHAATHQASALAKARHTADTIIHLYAEHLRLSDQDVTLTEIIDMVLRSQAHETKRYTFADIAVTRVGKVETRRYVYLPLDGIRLELAMPAKNARAQAA